MPSHVTLVVATVSLLLPLAGSAQLAEPETAVVAAEALLARVDLRPPQIPSGVSAEDLASAGITRTKLEATLTALLERCLEGQEECPESDWSRKDSAAARRGDAAQTLLGLIELVGTPESFALLYRLNVRGFYAAGSALDEILRREMLGAFARVQCAPPSVQEVRAVRAQLADFAAIQLREGKLVAQRPAPRELDDLSYFLAAAGESGPPVGAAQEQGGDWEKPAPTNAPLDAAYAELTAARMRGDLSAASLVAQRYLTLLGYPGPLKAFEENRYGWHGSRFSSVMRQWAEVRELLGEAGPAAELYRRAMPNDSACGTGADYTWLDQVHGFIRTKEAEAGCRAVLAERLLETSGLQEDGAYGPARLRAAGFDIARLYRGALVTLNRDVPPADLERVLSGAEEPLRSLALARLRRLGTEAWELRVRALEGLADSMQRGSIPLLLEASRRGHSGARSRAVRALGGLTERPTWDVCAGGLGGLGSSQWERPIRPLARVCGGELAEGERRKLVAQLTPFLSSEEGATREAAAEALGKIGSPSARSALKALAADPYTDGYRLESETDRELPIYPAREAASEALARIDEVETSRRASSAQ